MTIYEYNKLRDEALKDLDIDTFKAFWNKMSKKGICPPLSDDEDVIELTMYKVAYHSLGVPDSTRERAKQWILDHGFSTSLF